MKIYMWFKKKKVKRTFGEMLNGSEVLNDIAARIDKLLEIRDLLCPPSMDTWAVLIKYKNQDLRDAIDSKIDELKDLTF